MKGSFIALSSRKRSQIAFVVELSNGLDLFRRGTRITIMAGSMFQTFEGNRLAISDRGTVAVLKRHENCVVLYGKGTLESTDQQWMARKLRVGLLNPYDVYFAPNNHLVVSDIGDTSLKIFNLDDDQRQVNQIVIGHDSYNRLIIQDLQGMNREFASRALLIFRGFRIPQNIVVGPRPLSQLFVTCGTEVILINMDWNKLSPISYFPVCSPMDWRFVQYDKSLVCDNVSTVQDHRVSHKVGGFNPLAITKAQFCGMFYHVTETGRAGFLCLQRSECNVGKRGDRKKFSETVVIYVRIMDKNGRLIFHARYGNCYEGALANTTHAEYFMLVDEEFRQAAKLLREQKGGNISMYMNKQPCFRSTGHGKKTELKVKDCAQDLINFYNLHCSPHGIKLTINLCQLYKVDMLSLPHETSLSQDIRNAQLGLKILLSSGIELHAMSQESWRKLAEFAGIELPEYQGSDRQKLDQHIHNVLSEMTRTPITLLHRFVQNLENSTKQ